MYVMYVTTTAHPCPSWQPMLPDSPVDDGARPIPAGRRLKFSQSSTPQLFAREGSPVEDQKDRRLYSPVFCSNRHPRTQRPTPNTTYRQNTAAVLINTVSLSSGVCRNPSGGHVYRPTRGRIKHPAYTLIRLTDEWAPASRFAGRAAAISSHLINQASSKYQPPNLIVISKSSSTPPLPPPLPPPLTSPPNPAPPGCPFMGTRFSLVCRPSSPSPLQATTNC
ncbi:hypothetical protein BKA56DRAFT_291166 [Ilyonectria sp. MPI-CAGE-AT-0026]|nr:hypothetical protein BKA56DRAFT_291166 [Ilyonectria sp. MPI-CAGE-AT-0026]